MGRGTPKKIDRTAKPFHEAKVAPYQQPVSIGQEWRRGREQRRGGEVSLVSAGCVSQASQSGRRQEEESPREGGFFCVEQTSRVPHRGNGSGVIAFLE